MTSIPNLPVRSGAAIGLLLVIAACGTSRTTAAPPPEPPQETALALAIDINPDPTVVEINLEARESLKAFGNGPPATVWTYNGTVPGPLIDASVGNRLVVHFRNSLPEPTTIHWHGVRVPATMDGTMAMQQPVLPGGTFTYEFTLKDAGLFWFHPHVRSDAQVNKGLYGTLRIRGPAEPLVDQGFVLVLDDLRLKPDGTPDEYLDDDSKMMGRGGNTLLLNGLVAPTLRLKQGGLSRFRVVNAANGRFFNLRLPGHTWHVIGTDGGFVPKPYDTDLLLVAPGERYDVTVSVQGEPGAELVLTNEPYARGHDSGSETPASVASIRVVEGPRLPSKPSPSAFPDIERLSDGPVDFPIVLNEKIENGELVFTINDAVYPKVPTLQVRRGDVRIFNVRNDSEMDHPFHLHGFFFQILAQNGNVVPSESLANKDTTIVRAKGELKLVTRFDEPGVWMYHCHILEHAERGMVGEIRVE